MWLLSLMPELLWLLTLYSGHLSCSQLFDRTPPSGRRTRALAVFLLQLLFNFFWSIIFFNLQAFGFALLWLAALWGLLLWMILSFARVEKTAALLQIPYLLWVTFALYLNAGVWVLNR